MTTAKLYVLRVVKPDMTSRAPSGYSKQKPFKYPESGPVECPDWQDDDNCGHGLHGWLWGAGDLRSCDYWDTDGAKWLVIEVDPSDLRHGSGDLVGKCKFRRGEVVFCGSRDEAVKFITERAPFGTPILFGTATAGDRGTATAGDGGTAMAGDGGTAMAGRDGTATAGDGGTATAGYGGTATAGDGGTATAGSYGTATAGDGGTATTGDGGTATAGDGGTAMAGRDGTATAGYGGSILLRFWTGSRYRWIHGEIGENGLKPNTPYTLDSSGAFVEKK
jgi:hypothetical protein